MVSYSNRYTHCMVEAGRAADAIEELKNAAEKANTPEEISAALELFPRGGIFSVFSTAPELIPQGTFWQAAGDSSLLFSSECSY